MKCNSSIQNGPSWWIGRTSEWTVLANCSTWSNLSLGPIVPEYQRATTSNVEMGKFTKENFMRSNHEPLCLLCSICLVQDGGFFLNYSSWLMGKYIRLHQTGLGVPRMGDSWREQLSDSSAWNSAPGSVWELQARACAFRASVCLAGQPRWQKFWGYWYRRLLGIAVEEMEMLVVF